MGDFNEILEVDEHLSYQEAGVMTAGMKEFESVVQYCHFTDMGYQGPKFTWCNRRDEGIVCKKLDRILVNEACFIRDLMRTVSLKLEGVQTISWEDFI